MADARVRKKDKFAKFPSVLLAQYAYKILAYMNDLNQKLGIANELYRNHKDILGDYDMDKAGTFLADQLAESQKMFNEINVELEARIHSDIGFEFKYYQTDKYASEIENFMQLAQKKVRQQHEKPNNDQKGGLTKID